MRISDWSSDVCSSDLLLQETKLVVGVEDREIGLQPDQLGMAAEHSRHDGVERAEPRHAFHGVADHPFHPVPHFARRLVGRSEEHTSELQSLMRISYAVFCLKTKITPTITRQK